MAKQPPKIGAHTDIGKKGQNEDSCHSGRLQHASSFPRASCTSRCSRSDRGPASAANSAGAKRHIVAAEQMRNFGGMVSFVPRGGVEAAHRIVTSTELFGDVDVRSAVEPAAVSG